MISRIINGKINCAKDYSNIFGTTIQLVIHMKQLIKEQYKNFQDNSNSDIIPAILDAYEQMKSKKEYLDIDPFIHALKKKFGFEYNNFNFAKILTFILGEIDNSHKMDSKYTNSQTCFTTLKDKESSKPKKSFIFEILLENEKLSKSIKKKYKFSEDVSEKPCFLFFCPIIHEHHPPIQIDIDDEVYLDPEDYTLSIIVAKKKRDKSPNHFVLYIFSEKWFLIEDESILPIENKEDVFNEVKNQEEYHIELFGYCQRPDSDIVPIEFSEPLKIEYVELSPNCSSSPPQPKPQSASLMPKPQSTKSPLPHSSSSSSQFASQLQSSDSSSPPPPPPNKSNKTTSRQSSRISQFSSQSSSDSSSPPPPPKKPKQQTSQQSSRISKSSSQSSSDSTPQPLPKKSKQQTSRQSSQISQSSSQSSSSDSSSPPPKKPKQPTSQQSSQKSLPSLGSKNSIPESPKSVNNNKNKQINESKMSKSKNSNSDRDEPQPKVNKISSNQKNSNKTKSTNKTDNYTVVFADLDYQTLKGKFVEIKTFETSKEKEEYINSLQKEAKEKSNKLFYSDSTNFGDAYFPDANYVTVYSFDASEKITLKKIIHVQFREYRKNLQEIDEEKLETHNAFFFNDTPIKKLFEYCSENLPGKPTKLYLKEEGPPSTINEYKSEKKTIKTYGRLKKPKIIYYIPNEKD